MTLPQLKYFCKLAELQHYTKAAQELFISQPSLSLAIRSLESELGLKLFQKSGRNVVLTKEGWGFYNYASKSLATLEKGIELVRKYNEDEDKNIDLAINMASGHFVSKVYKEFNKGQGKGVEFTAIEGDSTERVIECITSGNSDIGFGGLIEGRNDLVFVPVYKRPTMIAVRKDHPLAKERSVNLDQLKPYKIITYPLSMNAGKKLKTVLDKHQLDVDYKQSSVNILCTLCYNSVDSVALMFDSELLRRFTELVFIPISDITKDFLPICLIYDPERFYNKSCMNFIDFVKKNYSLY